MKAGAFSPATREIVTARSCGVCERCRGAAVQEIHHRRARGMGGSRRPSTAGAANALALCAPCHHWAERNREEAGRLGYLVPQSWEPADVSVWIDGQWVLFDDMGGVHVMSEEAD